VDFTANNQSIWGTGDAFQFGYHQFLGISDGSDGHQDGTKSGLATFKGGFGPGIAHDPITSSHFGFTIGGTIGLKAGFQVDLNINGGSWNASLPFNITLNNVYNKTTDTLQVGATDTAGTGTFNSTGPGGNFDLKAILDAFLGVHGTICVVLCASTSTRVPKTGAFGGTKTLLKLNSSNLKTSFDLGGGVSLSLTWPQVNTTGMGPATNVMTPQVMAQGLGLSVDVIDLLLTAIIGSDPLKGSIPGLLSYTILAADLKAGLDLAQQFTLSDAGIGADLLVGTNQVDVGALNFGGSPLQIQNVSSDGLNPDGTVPLALKVTLDNPQLQNITSLVPTAGASLTLGKVDLLGKQGTLLSTGITVPLGSFKISGQTFPAVFAQQTTPTVTAT
jgi:hypothetical protein